MPSGERAAPAPTEDVSWRGTERGTADRQGWERSGPTSRAEGDTERGTADRQEWARAGPTSRPEGGPPAEESQVLLKGFK